MGESTWTARVTSQTVTIVLNSLANDIAVQSTAEIDNSTNKDMFCALMLKLASLDLSAQDNPAIYIWFLDKVDAVQEDYNTVPARMPDAIIPLEEVSDTQNVIARNIKIPALSFDIVIQNKTGAALPSSGNTFEIETYGIETA